jgi:peptidyl-prolyl cis-trans isomerase SurA
MLRPSLAVLALLSALPAVAAAPANSDQPPGELLDRMVAVVNNGIVTQSELEERMAQAVADLRRNNTQPPAADVLQRAVLDRLVMDEIQWQEAERSGIEITDEMLNEQLRQMAEANDLTLDQLPEQMARQGIHYASFREELRKELARQQLRRREVRNRVYISPRELEQHMARLAKLPDELGEYNYSHILIALPIDATQEQVDALAKRADEVYQRAATEDFAQLAVTYSNSQSALEGGQMGWVRGTNLPPSLAEVIVALKPGEVSKPVSNANGFHIVKLNAVRSAAGDPVQEQTHARHILLNPNALQDDATVRQRLADIRERVLAGEDFAAFASSLSEDKETAVNGGDLDWIAPGGTVAEFEAAMSKLKDGEISEPFQTQFGWHIVQVLGRRQFDTTEEALRNRAASQLVEGKADQELELWLRRLRDESYVETDLN